MMSEGTEHDDGLQELMNCFDDIPRMMSNMQKVDKDAYTTCAGHNQSIEMESAMRMFKPISCSPADRNKIGRMATQAQKVLDHLARIPGRREARDVGEMSTIAKEKLQKIEENGLPLAKLYSQYDVHKSGKVTYNDFTDSLLAVSSGLRKDEVEVLAKSLDTSKSGTIEYKNILGALKEIEANNPVPHKQKAANPLPASYMESPLRRFNKMTIQLSNKNDEEAADLLLGTPTHRRSVSDTVNIVEPLSPAVMKSAYENEYHSSSSSRMFSTDFSHPQRRYFGYTNVDNVSTTQNAPYFTDLNPDQVKARRSHRRSCSSPLDSSMIAMQLLDSNPPTTDTDEQQQHRSLHNALLKQSSTPKSPVKASYPDAESVRQQRAYATKSTAPRNPINGENALISELGPRANTLKRYLHEFDTSQTGSVTGDEFRKAVVKAGLSLRSDQVKELFSTLTSDTALQETASVKHQRSNGFTPTDSCLNVDSFIDRLKARTSSSTYKNLLPPSGTADSDPSNEERRVFKKVLHASTKPGIAPLLEHSAGFIDKQTLKETVQRNGTNLTATELATLMNCTASLENHQGLIEVTKLDQFLNEKAREAVHHQSARSSKVNDLFSQRYSNTFDSSQLDSSLMNAEEIKSSSFHSAAIGTGERKQWKSLQTTFQKNEDRILAAFTDAQPGEREFSKKELSSPAVVCKATPKELTVAQLKVKLRGVGLSLGDEDFRRLERRIAHEEGESKEGKVTLRSFCEVVGIPMVTRTDGRIALTHKHATESAGLGSFAASALSQSAHPSFSTSMGLITAGGIDGTVAFDDAINGKRLARKVPQPLHAHLTGEPSKWFELRHSTETEQKLGTFQLHYRSSSTPRGGAPRAPSSVFPSSSEQQSVSSSYSTQGLPSGQREERGRSHHRRVSSLTQHFNDNDSVASFSTINTTNTADTSNCTTNDGHSHSKRSSSAPPRSYESSASTLKYQPKRFVEAHNSSSKGQGQCTPKKQSSLASYYGLVTPV